MSFISSLKQIKLFKKGKKAALAGSFKEAILLFDKAYLLSSDLKSKYENITWLHLSKALQLERENNLLLAKEEYAEFNSAHRSYIEICKSTPGIGTETRYQTWLMGIKELLTLYQNKINLIKE
jgi:hypothetical protein